MGEDDKYRVNVNVGGGNGSTASGPGMVPSNDQNVIKPSTPTDMPQSVSPSSNSDPSVIRPSMAPESSASPTSTPVSPTISPTSSPTISTPVNPTDSSSNLVQPSSTIPSPSGPSALHTPPAQGMLNSTPSPVQGPATVSNSPIGSSMGASTPPRSPKGKKKVLLVGVLAAVFILGGSASAYFGYVVPNNPTNVWSKAMSNTSKGYDKLVEYQEGNKDKTTTKIDGTYNISSPEFSADGGYGFEGDQKNTKSRFDIGIMGSRVNVDMLTELSDSSTYPDVYFKAEGIKPFGAIIGDSDPELASFLDQVDSQWFVVDRSFFSQALAGSKPTETESSQVTQEDIDALSKIIGDVSKQYLFTDDESKAVFNANEFIGKEDVDGRQQFHYKVGVNKANLKSYVSELAKNFEATEAYKKLVGDSEPINLDDINTSIDGIDDSYKADVWVDAKTKLVRTIRFSDKENSNNYLDLGLKYDGGTKFPFYIKVVGDDESGKGELNFQVTLDTSNDNVDINMTAKIEGDTAVDMSLTGSAVLSNEAVQLDNKPTNAKSFMELMGFSGPIDGPIEGPIQPLMPPGGVDGFDQSNLGPTIVDSQGNLIDSGLLGVNTEVNSEQANNILNQLYAGLMSALNRQ